MTPKTIIVFLVTAILLTSCESSEEYWLTNPDSYNAATIYTDNTSSLDAPFSINDLPKPIKDSAIKHLIGTTGKDFYAKLKYDGGQILEYNDGSKTYHLHFSFNDLDAGIKKYTSTVSLNQNGNLIDIVDLPDISKHSYKSKLIDIREAYKIALEKTIDRGKLFNAGVSFDKNVSSIEWTFTLETDKGKKQGYKHIISINAHNGEVLEQHKMLEYSKGMIENPDDLDKIIDSTQYK